MVSHSTSPSKSAQSSSAHPGISEPRSFKSSPRKVSQSISQTLGRMLPDGVRSITTIDDPTSSCLSVLLIISNATTIKTIEDRLPVHWDVSVVPSSKHTTTFKEQLGLNPDSFYQAKVTANDIG